MELYCPYLRAVLRWECNICLRNFCFYFWKRNVLKVYMNLWPFLSCGFKYSSGYFLDITNVKQSWKSRMRSSLVAQWLKDLVLSLLWCRSLLWRRFNPWPRNFHAPQHGKKKKKKKLSERHSLSLDSLSIFNGRINFERNIMQCFNILKNEYF